MGLGDSRSHILARPCAVSTVVIHFHCALATPLSIGVSCACVQRVFFSVLAKNVGRRDALMQSVDAKNGDDFHSFPFV